MEEICLEMRDCHIKFRLIRKSKYIYHSLSEWDCDNVLVRVESCEIN